MRALAAVAGMEIGRRRGPRRPRARHEGRTPVPRVVARAGRARP